MALVFFSGFETGDFSEFVSVASSPALDDGTLLAPHTGDYHMRSDGLAYATPLTGIDFTHVTFYIHIVDAPDGECILVGSSSYVSVRLTTDLYLKLYDEAVEEDAGGTQLVVDKWYRICIASSGGTAKVYLDGIEEMSSATIAAGLNCAVGVGTSVAAVIYFDNIAVDKEANTNDLGDIRVRRASPNAAGQYAEFDTISGYTYCDEVPADGATTIVDDSGVSAMHRETYNLQDWDTIGGGASDTIKAVNILVQAYDSGASLQGITVRDDGTDYETMLEFGKAYTWKNKLYVTNAPRASAWTPAIFTAFQAGGYSEGSKDVYMSCVMVMVAFIPSVGDPVLVTPPTVALAITTYEPTVTVTLNQLVTPATVTLAITTYEPTVTVSSEGWTTIAKFNGVGQADRDTSNSPYCRLDCSFSQHIIGFIGYPVVRFSF